MGSLSDPKRFSLIHRIPEKENLSDNRLKRGNGYHLLFSRVTVHSSVGRISAAIQALRIAYLHRASLASKDFKKQAESLEGPYLKNLCQDVVSQGH